MNNNELREAFLKQLDLITEDMQQNRISYEQYLKEAERLEKEYINGYDE